MPSRKPRGFITCRIWLCTSFSLETHHVRKEHLSSAHYSWHESLIPGAQTFGTNGSSATQPQFPSQGSDQLLYPMLLKRHHKVTEFSILHQIPWGYTGRQRTYDMPLTTPMKAVPVQLPSRVTVFFSEVVTVLTGRLAWLSLACLLISSLASRYGVLDISKVRTEHLRGMQCCLFPAQGPCLN